MNSHLREITVSIRQKKETVHDSNKTIPQLCMYVYAKEGGVWQIRRNEVLGLRGDVDYLLMILVSG